MRQKKLIAIFCIERVQLLLQSNLRLSRSKVNRDCFRFALLRSVIGPKDSHDARNQSDAELKPITTSSPAFSRALSSLYVFIAILLRRAWIQLPSSDNLGHWPRVSKVSPSKSQIPRSVPSLLCPPVDLCPQSHSHLVLKCHAFHTSLIWDSKKDNGYGQASSFDREWKLAAHASLESSFLWLHRAVLVGIVVGAY